MYDDIWNLSKWERIGRKYVHDRNIKYFPIDRAKKKTKWYLLQVLLPNKALLQTINPSLKSRSSADENSTT